MLRDPLALHAKQDFTPNHLRERWSQLVHRCSCPPWELAKVVPQERRQPQGPLGQLERQGQSVMLVKQLVRGLP